MSQNSDLALIGAGYWGKNLARNLLDLGALHTLCDADSATLGAYSDQYDRVRRCSDYRDVLADTEIGKVAIATPATTHFDLAREALEADKDVYVEKPLCLDPGHAELLIESAERRGRVLMVGHLLQYHPCVQEIIRMVRAGELGRLYYISSNRLNLGRVRQEENSLWSFAPHDISVILALAGDVPRNVYCHGASYLTSGVADTTLTHMQFHSGVQAHVHVSWLNPFKEQKLTVVGSEGMIVFDDTLAWDDKLMIYRNYLTWSDGKVPLARKSAGERIVVPEAEPLRAECQHFLESCAARTRPRTDGAEGLRVLRVLHAAQQSLENNGSPFTPVATAAPPGFWAHPTAIIDGRAHIGARSKIWHFSHVSDDAVLGEDCNLGQNVFIAPGVSIGSNVKIQNNVSIYAGITIEDDVFLGPSCVLTNVSNPRSQVVRRGIYEKTLIRRGATIGANATIVCGVTLGRYAFVAAGAVVTKDIPDYGMVRGVPAKHVGWISRHGHPLEFGDSDTALCAETRLLYRKQSASDATVTVHCEDLAEEAAMPKELATGRKPYREIQRT